MLFALTTNKPDHIVTWSFFRLTTCLRESLNHLNALFDINSNSSPIMHIGAQVTAMSGVAGFEFGPNF